MQDWTLDNKDLHKQVDYLESQQRRDNLVFTGLQVAAADVVCEKNTSSCVIQQILKVCSEQLACNVKPDDISFAYVLPLRRNAAPNYGKLLVA